MVLRLTLPRGNNQFLTRSGREITGLGVSVVQPRHNLLRTKGLGELEYGCYRDQAPRSIDR